MKFAHLAILALLTVPATAAIADERDEVCAKFSDDAHKIMMARQTGMSLQEVIRIVVDATPSQSSKDLVRSVIINAYKSPRYLSEDLQDRAARDFADRYHVYCLE